MTEFWNGLLKAIQLILSLDPEVMQITGRSLWIAATSCTASFFLIALPLGSVIHFNNFRGKKLLISTIQTLFSLPAVAVGLIVFVLFSRAGPLGIFGLYLTPWVMIIGQMMLITPVMLGLIISALSSINKAIPETAIALGANQFQASIVTIREARYGILTAMVMGFGRAISEVGVWIAKKKYMHLKLWEDGNTLQKPSLKATGVEIIQSSTPPFARKYLKEIVLWILKKGNNFQNHYSEFIAYLRDMALILTNTPDSIEGTKAFIEKRKPQWTS